MTPAAPIALLLTAVLGCSSPPASTKAGEGDPAPPTAVAPARDEIAPPASKAPEPSASEPPAPTGFVVPAVGRLRKATAGDRTTAYVWEGVYEADPADPRIQEVTAKRAGPGAPDAGDAAAILYAEQVKAAGIATSTLDYSFDYVIQGGKLNVIIRPDDDFHQGDPNGFTVSVGIPGG